MKRCLHEGELGALYDARHGLMLVNKFDAYVGRSVVEYGEWCDDEVDLLRAICHDGDTVIEVGSNIGTHTVPIARFLGKTGRLHAFEPQRVVYQNLCANIALNSLTNVDAHCMGASDKDGVAWLPEIDYGAVSNFGGFRLETGGVGTKVPTVRLDNAIQTSSLKLIKIDAEDMEMPVIAGASSLIQAHRPLIYYENNPGSPLQYKLNAAVLNLGYDIYWHVTPLFNPQNFFSNQENVFGGTCCFNILAVPEGVSVDFLGRFRLTRILSPDQWPPTD